MQNVGSGKHSFDHLNIPSSDDVPQRHGLGIALRQRPESRLSSASGPLHAIPDDV